MKRLSLIVFLTAAGSLGAANLNIFPFYKDAVAGGNTSRALGSIILDSEIYQRTNVLSSDLRLESEDGKQIPFVLRAVYRHGTHQRHESYRSIIENLKKDGNTLVLIVRSPEGAKKVDAVSINSPSKDFEKQLSVEGSNDKKSWVSLAAKQLIFDCSSIIALKNLTVKIPSSQYRYWRISIDNFTEEQNSPVSMLITEKQPGSAGKETIARLRRKEALQIDSVVLENTSQLLVNSELEKQSYAIKVKSIAADGKKTVLSLESHREPLTEFRIFSSSENFSRNIMLYSSNDAKSWARLAETDWSRSSVLNKSSDHGKITFAESRKRFYRIIINNGDNDKLKDLEIKARGNIYELLMLGNLPQKLKVFYGAAAPRPDYELARLLPDVVTLVRQQYRLSGELPNENFVKAPAKINYRWLFSAVILIMAALLVFILYKNLGHLNHLEKSEE